MYFCVPCYWRACLSLSALRVGVKKLYVTQHNASFFVDVAGKILITYFIEVSRVIC